MDQNQVMQPGIGPVEVLKRKLEDSLVRLNMLTTNAHSSQVEVMATLTLELGRLLPTLRQVVSRVTELENREAVRKAALDSQLDEVKKQLEAVRAVNRHTEKELSQAVSQLEQYEEFLEEQDLWDNYLYALQDKETSQVHGGSGS